jgi:hypothetical protein
MYEHLAQYLDLDMTLAHQQQQPTLETLPASTASLTHPPLAPLASTTGSSFKPLLSSRPPTLLPKPTVESTSSNSSSLFLLPNGSATSTTLPTDDTSTNDNGKRPSIASTTDDRLYADDDKVCGTHTTPKMIARSLTSFFYAYSDDVTQPPVPDSVSRRSKKNKPWLKLSKK